MPGNHAFLSPSSSVRWYFCPPSARLCEQFPDQGSVFASEGTDAHKLCEYLLKKELGFECSDPRPSLQYYSPEMEEAAQGYVQYIRETVKAYGDAKAVNGVVCGADIPQVYVEQRLDLREYIPESMGTADCVIICGDTVEIVDFKYGMYRVPATSMQLRVYALGACEVFSLLYDFSVVRMSVYQPRLSSVDETEMSVADLYDWARKELAPRARQAFDGVGEFACGEWCRVCRARRNCRALAEHRMEIAQYGFTDPALLSDEEIADVLSRVDELVSWATDVRDYALREALSGHAYPGFKVVAGRTVRRYTDDALAASRVVAAGKDPWEKKLLSVAAMEKMLGKKAFGEMLSDLVTRSPGKPLIVPVSDKRPEIVSAENEFSAVKESEDESDE